MDPTLRNVIALGLVAILGIGGAIIAWSVGTPDTPADAPVTSTPQTTPSARTAPVESALEPTATRDRPDLVVDRTEPARRADPTPRRPPPTARPRLVVPPEMGLDPEEVAELERELEQQTEADRQFMEARLRELAMTGIDDEGYEAARGLLEVELEHRAVLRRDEAIGGLDPDVAQAERTRIQGLTDEALEDAIGDDLRRKLRRGR